MGENMEQLKKHKKELILFAIVFVIALTMCGAFLQPHYTHDTYRIVYDGYADYAQNWFLKEARPFSALLTFGAGAIGLSIESYSLISFLLAIVFFTCSIIIVYKIFEKELTKNSKWMHVLILITSFVIIFNYLAIEHIFFVECCMFALGILLSVLAAKVVINKEQYAHIKAFIILVIGAFCYQGSIAIFPMIVFAHELLLKKQSFKENFMELLKTTLVYGIAMFLTIIFARIMADASRISMNFDAVNISTIISTLKDLVVNSLGVIPPYVNIGVIAFTILYIVLFDKSEAKAKTFYILKYLLVVLAAITICMAPVFVGSATFIYPRISIAYGTTIGISLLVMLYIVQNSKKKYQLIIVSVIIIITFILNFGLYVALTNQHILTNKIDKESCLLIKQKVEEYEEDTGITITKIASIIHPRVEAYYPNMIHAGAITQKALGTWATRETISFYLDRKLLFVDISPEQYIPWWGDKHWNSFSIEQVVLEGDTLYFCAI